MKIYCKICNQEVDLSKGIAVGDVPLTWVCGKECRKKWDKLYERPRREREGRERTKAIKRNLRKYGKL